MALDWHTLNKPVKMFIFTLKSTKFYMEYLTFKNIIMVESDRIILVFLQVFLMEFPMVFLMVFCNCIVTTGGVYNKISPESEGFPRSSANISLSTQTLVSRLNCLYKWIFSPPLVSGSFCVQLSVPVHILLNGTVLWSWEICATKSGQPIGGHGWWHLGHHDQKRSANGGLLTKSLGLKVAHKSCM